MAKAEQEPGDSGYDTVENPERGCGFLKEGKAYLRSELSALGVLPPVVEFDEPIMWLEGHFRGYARFPGIGFELRQTPTPQDYLNSTASVGQEDARRDMGDALNLARAPGAVRDSPGVLDDLRAVDPAGEWETQADPPLEVHRHIERLQTDYEREGPDGEHLGEMRSARAHDLLMWVGESYYDQPQDFIRECREEGLSKAIPTSKNQEPPVINPGRTRVFLVHPRAVETGTDDDGNPTYEPGLIGYAYVTRVVYTGKSTGDGVDFPEWAQEYAESGRMELVEIGEKQPAAAVENGATLQDFVSEDGTVEADEQELRDALGRIPQQRLRGVVADADGVEVSNHPEKGELIDAIVDNDLANVAFSPESDGDDGGDDE